MNDAQLITTANDNGKHVISKINIFAVGRSGRRVSHKSGREFGLEVVYDNGVIIERTDRFPSYYMAVAHTAKIMRLASQAGLWP